MSAIKIRPYNPSDLPDLEAIFLDAVHRGCAKHYTPEQLNAWAPRTLDTLQWGKRLRKNKCWLAEKDGIAVGFTELTDPDHLHMLFVHSDHHRQGIASSLLKEAESMARELGAEKITTEASRTARPFFEKSGFVLIAAQTVVYQGIAIQNFKMAKHL